MSKPETKPAAAVAVPSVAALAAEVAAEAAALAAKRAALALARRNVATAGRYGRVPSVVDALRAFARETPAAAFSVDGLALRAEAFFVAANDPKRKVSPESSRLYTGEVTEAFALVGLLSAVVDAKDVDYRLAPAFVAILAPKK